MKLFEADSMLKCKFYIKAMYMYADNLQIYVLFKFIF